ncbi:MAG: glycosyltransferase family 1 protein, partial [Waddliaceae bacterium]
TRSYGIWPRCCLIYKGGKATYGMPFSEVVKVAKSCDLLITRSGKIDKVPEIFENAKCRAFFDGNPGNTQVFFYKQEGEFEALDRYEYLFTLGLNIGTSQCAIPTGEHRWLPAVRPVVLPMWPVRTNPDSKRFTTISTWKGRTTFQWEGQSSGEKSDNWLSFLNLPKITRQEFEIALRLDSPNHKVDRKMFQENGWWLTDPRKLQNLDDYRNYIGKSRAEFSVAHNRYVEFSTGWFSDRSALYLASGKPVLVQSTGIEHHLPTGKGLLTFTTMEEAIAGIEEINRDYLVHCRAAREIAKAYFDSDKVLTKILNQIGSCSS